MGHCFEYIIWNLFKIGLMSQVGVNETLKIIITIIWSLAKKKKRMKRSQNILYKKKHVIRQVINNMRIPSMQLKSIKFALWMITQKLLVKSW